MCEICEQKFQELDQKVLAALDKLTRKHLEMMKENGGLN